MGTPVADGIFVLYPACKEGCQNNRVISRLYLRGISAGRASHILSLRNHATGCGAL